MTDVCVVGLGKIGLPLACAIARAGHRVRGADISRSVVDQVNDAKEPFPGEAGLAQALEHTVGAGLLSATDDTAGAVTESDVVIVVVPLVVDEKAQPDFGAMDAATRSVAAGLQPGTLVSYETTLPVGTTRNRFAPALATESGLQPGEDLFVVHSPERVFSGRIFEDLRRYPKLVGGVDKESARRGARFYESFLEFDERPDLARPNGVWDLGTAEAAELAKLAETTYRDLNIAFANELAMASDSLGVDVYDVIGACNSQPYSHIHQPGVSVGGHCIPVYPHFLLSSVEHMRLPALARRVNGEMPGFTVDALVERMGPIEGRRIVVLGLSYREGVKEDAFSGAFSLVEEIRNRGGVPLVHDPLYEPEEIRSRGLEPFSPGSDADGAVLHTAHPVYQTFDPSMLAGLKTLVDGRNVLDRNRWPGVDLVVLGGGGHDGTRHLPHTSS